MILGSDGTPTFWKEGERDNTDKRVVTGPVVGDDLTMAKDDALKLEVEIYKKYKLPTNIQECFKRFSLFGLRRAILLYPQDISWKWTKDHHLMLSFFLPSGAYASVVVDCLEEQLSE